MSVVTCPNCGAKNRVDPAAAREKRAVCGRCGEPLPAAQDKPATVTDADFEAFLKSAGERPVLVDCWAAWCGPCRMLAPTIDALASESGGRYAVAKLDTDTNPRTAARFQVDALPTLLIFRRGQVVDRLVGLQPKLAIAASLAAATHS